MISYCNNRTNRFSDSSQTPSERQSSRERFPEWLKRPVPPGGQKFAVERRLAGRGLHTVCKEAKCPNRCECYGAGKATFLIMGDVCSRSCSFCSVESGIPGSLDPDEPEKLCTAAKELGLRYVVITSVTRDDLPDGGASHFAKTVGELKQRIPGIGVEVLVPDFKGNTASIDTVVSSGIDVFNHNIETIPRLYPSIRPQANYRQSLNVLRYAAQLQKTLQIKSGVMLGLGEKDTEVLKSFEDLRKAGCTILTIGQYLQPSPSQARVVEFIAPQQFEHYNARAREMGFIEVAAGPFVRSSYRAGEIFEKIQNHSGTTDT
ncbi:MAG: lipoyl synthase [Chitinivibrionales bacterium]|nr:lipoyl synthase [Chitinivibrionales bacterium]